MAENEKSNKSVYSEIKDSNRRDKPVKSKGKTRSYNGLKLPLDVYQFFTNILADKRKETETDRLVAQDILDSLATMDKAQFNDKIKEIRGWMKQRDPGFVDESYSRTHSMSDNELVDAARTKRALAQALRDNPNLQLFTNVPEAPTVTGTEGKTKEYTESDKDRDIREKFEAEHAEDKAKVKKADSDLRDFVDNLVAEYNFISDEIKHTDDPEQKTNLQDELLLVQANLMQGFKQLGIAGAGMKEANSSGRLKDLLALYDAQRRKEDAAVSNAANEEVFYGSADPDNTQYEKSVDEYKRAQQARKVAAEERAENKEALTAAKEAYKTGRETLSQDLGESDTVGFLTDPWWVGKFVKQTKALPTKKSIIEGLGGKDYLSKKEQEYYDDFAKKRYEEMLASGALDNYKKRFASGIAQTPEKLLQSIGVDLRNEYDRVNGNIGRMRAEYMRDRKAGKKPHYTWNQIPTEAARHSTEGGYEDALYSTLPNWKSVLKEKLDDLQQGSDKETRNAMQNRDLFDDLIKAVVSDDTVSLRPEQFKVIEDIDEIGQDVLDNPENYSYRTRFLINEWYNTLNKMAAKQAYDKSNQDVKDQEAIMHENKAGYDNWKDFASRTNINELIKRLDTLKSKIEKNNKNDEIHLADAHQMSMSDEEKKQIRDLQAQIARLSMGQGRKVDVVPLGDNDFMATASGEGASFRFIMQADPNDPSKVKIYQARPRLSNEDMDAVRRDPNLSDAQKLKEMYITDGPAIGFVGSDDDLTFTLDDNGLSEENSEYSKSDIRLKAAQELAKKLSSYGLGRSPDSVIERRQYKENRKQVKQADLDKIKSELLGVKGFDNMVKVAKLGNMDIDRQEQALYNILNNTGLYYDPINEVPYASLEDAKAAGANMDTLKGPDESLGENSYDNIFKNRRQLGIEAATSKIEHASNSFKDDQGRTVQTISPDEKSGVQSRLAQGIRNKKTGRSQLKGTNKGEASTGATLEEIDIRRLRNMEKFGIDPDKLVEEGSNYKDKAFSQINAISDINDREAMLELANDLTSKHGKALLKQIRRNTEKFKQDARDYQNPYYDPLNRVKDKNGNEQYSKEGVNVTNDAKGKTTSIRPAVKKETIEPEKGADGNYKVTGDIFKMFGGAQLK